MASPWGAGGRILDLDLVLVLLTGETVEQQPVEAELADGFDELLELDGLDDVAVHAEAVALDQIALFLGGGQDDDRGALGSLVALDLAQHFQAVDLRQLEVEKDDFGKILAGA